MQKHLDRVVQFHLKLGHDILNEIESYPSREELLLRSNLSLDKLDEAEFELDGSLESLLTLDLARRRNAVSLVAFELSFTRHD